MAVIAIDLGTTACKSAVFEGGEMLGLARCHYGWSAPGEGQAEQDAEEVWSATENTVQCALRLAAWPRINAISVSVQGDAVIPIDIRGQALGPAILGMDTRSHREAFEMEHRFGRGPLYAATGMPCEPLNSITKITWMVRNYPEVIRKLWKFVHYEEFLLMKLAGIPALDFTMASRTMAFDPVRKDWLPDLLDFAGVKPSQLGNVCPSGVPVGIVLRSVAERWNIDGDALVVAGGHDQCVAAIGAGVVETDLATYSMGTAEVIGTCLHQFRASAAHLDSNYPCYCHAVPDHYFTITLNQSGGLSLEWFYQTVLGSNNDDSGYQQFLAHAESTLRFAPSPVLFLPHIVGSGTPTCDHLSRASFLGMSLSTTREDLFQAVLDALCFEAKLNLETLDNLGIPIAELRAVGGGAQSRQVLRLKASVLNRPISTLRTTEAGLLGAAMLAQVATGVYSNLAEAVDDCVAIRSTVEPDTSVAEEYDAAFAKYRQVYGTLKNFYHHWRDRCEHPAVV